MKIGITGASGLLGFHLRARLHALGRHDVRLASRETFLAPDKLDSFVAGLDAVVHLAGMNRGQDGEIEHANVRLAEGLVGALERTGSTPALVYSNSTHIARDTAYGRSKRQAAAVLGDWASRTGAKFNDLVLPNVFGEFGRPFYNSVVSTFCHQLAVGEQPEVHANSTLEFLHAQDVAQACIQAVKGDGAGTLRMPGARLSVKELLKRLRELYGAYLANVIPDLRDPLDLKLFNTLRSYLFPHHYPVRLALRADARGSLVEAVKTLHGGQTFFSSSYPGVTRGNHYHLRKVERFLVVAGEAEIRLRKLFSPDVISFRVSGTVPCYIDMPTFHTHSITNVGSSEVTTLFWASEIFDHADPDTYTEAVA